MAIRIFDADPDAQKRKPLEDVVGRFRSGALQSNRPVSLDEWRVTTGDPEVAETIQGIMGGDEPETWETKGEDNIEVYTTTSSVDIILDGPNAVKSAMVLWGRNGIIHTSDGETLSTGEPDPMAGKSLQERKEAAKAGYGSEPSVQVYFKLEGHEDLGKFKFFSGSWTLAEAIGAVEDKLAEIDGPARATLSLEVVEYTTKAGREVRFTKPVLNVKGAA